MAIKEKTKLKKSNALTKRAMQSFFANKLAVIGGIIVIVMVLLSFCAPLLTSYDPSYIDISSRKQQPSSEHLLGTDTLGRDIFTRILYGGQMSILIGVGSALGACALGVILGCVAGFFGGKVDSCLVFIQELVSTFPSRLLTLLFIAFMGKSTANLFIIFIFTGWPSVMRVVRGRIMTLKQEPFVESCRVNGISNLSIIFHHLMPNTMGPIIVDATGSVAGYILAEAGLSYLNMGVPDNVATWGSIINAANRLDIIQTMPMLWVAPGVAIALFVLSVNFLGDGLRDALDPTSK